MRLQPLFLLLASSAALAACAGGAAMNAARSSNGVLPATKHPEASATVVSLGSYNINPSKVFIAGISSGGFMAVQMHFAFSGTFKGTAIYAGGPDECAQDSETTALEDCGGDGTYGSELTPSENFINANQDTAGMDPVSNISGQEVYLWSGTGDTVVPQKTMNDLQTEYEHYGATVTYDNSFDAEHGWESLDGTVSCDTLSSPYMILCDHGSTPYDSQKKWLALFFGTLNARNSGTLNGSLMQFSQSPYGGGSNSLDTTGYIFVPQSCASGTQCGLVVALDGCEQYQEVIGDEFVTLAGLDEYADTNNFIVLYPYQTESSSNPEGCWDWWGYTNSSYALKSGVQMTDVDDMVKHVMGGTSSTPTPAPTATPSPTAAPSSTPSPTPTTSPTPSPTATPPYSQEQTNTVVEFYAEGDITLQEYLELGQAYGYDSEITLYDCNGTWTDSSTCGPMTY